MQDEYLDRTIEHLVNEINQGESELAENKRVVNRLCAKAQRPPLYPDAEAPTSASLGSIRRDQFYGQQLGAVIREYLGMRRSANQGPATVAEIYDALVKGGFAFETKDANNAKRNIRICLTKSSAVFHKLPNGNDYGLLDWYPEAKAKKAREPERQEEGTEQETEQEDAPATTTANVAVAAVPTEPKRAKSS